MKRILLGAVALITAMGSVGASTAFADDHGWRNGDNDRRGDWHGDRDRGGWGRHDNGWHNGWRGGDRGSYGNHPRWSRGQYIPRAYFNRYESVDYRYNHLRAPPYGYRYVRDDRGDILLAALATGLIVSVIASH